MYDSGCILGSQWCFKLMTTVGVSFKCHFEALHALSLNPPVIFLGKDGGSCLPDLGRDALAPPDFGCIAEKQWEMCKHDKWDRLPLFDELHKWDWDHERPSKWEARWEWNISLLGCGFMSNPKKTVYTSIKDFPLRSNWLSYFFLSPDRLELCWKLLISEGPDWVCYNASIRRNPS